jgi:hypothetical protein
MKQKSSTTSGKGTYGQLGIDIDRAEGNKKKKPLSRKEVMVRCRELYKSENFIYNICCLDLFSLHNTIFYLDEKAR